MKPNFRYDSERDSHKKQNMQEAIEFILSHKYGDTIGLINLAKILNYKLDDEKQYGQFKRAMGRIREFLITYGYILKPISHIGYYILKPKQISGHCYHTYILKTENILAKSNKILNHVDIRELDTIRKQELDNIQKLNTDLSEVIDSTITKSDYYASKDYYDNLED